LEFGGEAVHLKCAAGETRLRSLFLRERSAAVTDASAAIIRRAKKSALPAHTTMLLGRLDSVTQATGRFEVGGVLFVAADGVSLAGLRVGVVVRVVYAVEPGTRRALEVRRLGPIL
jgi:hypothetical protein